MGAAIIQAVRTEQSGLTQVAEQLVQALHKQDTKLVDQLILQLAREREERLFNELGTLTRELHSALSLFNDKRIIELTNNIPDAKERLDFVVNKTEESSLKTIELIEQMMPVCDNIEYQIQSTQAEVKDSINAGVDQIRTCLYEILTTQEFQDITGQLIKQVVNLVQEVEEKLLGIITTLHGEEQVSTVKTVASVNGPQINATENPDVIDTQDDVDKLLSSLGF